MNARVNAKLERRVDTDDGAAGSTTRFAQVSTGYLEVKTVGGREFWALKKQNPAVSHEVKTHFREDVTASDRWVFGSTVLNILTFFDPKSDRKELVMICEEIKG